MEVKDSKTVDIIDLRIQIREKLKSEGRSYMWLSKTTDWGYDSLYGCLVHLRIALSQERLEKVNAALGTDYVLPEKVEA